MERIYKYFSFFILGILVVITVSLPTIPELAVISELTFTEELTRDLSEGNTGIGSDSQFYESGINDLYTGLKSWGIVRGKNGGIPRADPGTPEILARYNSIYLGDTEKNIIYLTFDEGYENGYTGKILDILYENNVKALFFITGPYLDKEDVLIQRMLDEGHCVGNHTINHRSLPLLDEKGIEDEVVGLDRRFYQKYRKNMVFLRPPKGEYSEKSLEVTSKLGYINVFWSFAYDDWAVNRQRGREYAFEKVKQNLHNGEIILLHAVSKDNCEALNSIIEYARSAGYEFGDVFELEKLARGEG